MSADVPVDWDFHCKLTCVFGSEHGECACVTPFDCPLSKHPEFPKRRSVALERMRRYVLGPMVREMPDAPVSG